MGKILSTALMLNFTPDTSGYYRLKLVIFQCRLVDFQLNESDSHRRHFIDKAVDRKIVKMPKARFTPVYI